MRRRPRFRVLILLLAAVLAATPVLAARREPSSTFRQAPGIFLSLWQTLERFLPSLTKGRSTIDPDGAPAPNSGTLPSGGESDGRSTIDPNG